MAETSFDYLQEAASPLNLDGSDDDDHDDLRNQSASFYNHFEIETGLDRGQQNTLGGVTSATLNSPSKQQQQQQQQPPLQTSLNDSTELFYSAASAVSACLPTDGASPEKNTAWSASSDFTDNEDKSAEETGDTSMPLEKKEPNAGGGVLPPETPVLKSNMLEYNESNDQYPSTITPTATSAVSEAKSFVNGLLSPFSPILTKENLPREELTECMQFVSLQPCRKVSVVVRVLAVPHGDDDANIDPAKQRCVFPHHKDEGVTEDNDGTVTSNQKGNANEPEKDTGASASTSRRSILPRDMVVVNPSAFGKYIPSQVTMETAKLVAQVAHISSEDWARLYEFHHVMWASADQGIENGHTEPTSPASTSQSKYNTMDALSRAVSQDALVEHQSSLLISLGQEASCIGTDNDPDQLGLWTMILDHCQALVETKGMLRLSMVEILEDKPDSFRDLLFYSHRHHHQQHDSTFASQETLPDKPVITLRHPDMKGAVLEGLTEVSIDSMPALLESLARRRRRRNQAVMASTAVIGILKYWDSAVSYELGRPSSSQITCVELSNGNHKDQSRAESIVHRKSTVSLGQALRQLLLQSSMASKSTPEISNAAAQALGGQGSLFAAVPAVSFRETTLTKVLQRAMESSKICLVASISPLSKDYEQTITTLNYLRRLLVSPGKTATSPFKPTKNETQEGGVGNISFASTLASTLSSKAATQADVLATSARKNNERLQELAQQKGMLQTLIADPRQRLAKILKTSPHHQQAPPAFELQSSYDKDEGHDFLSNDSSHNYQPTNYMSNVSETLGGSSFGEKRPDSSSVDQGGSPVGTESRVDETNRATRQRRTSEELRLKPQDDSSFGNLKEWASEEEVEQALQEEIEGVMQSLYPEENFSDDEDDVSFQNNPTADSDTFPESKHKFRSENVDQHTWYDDHGRSGAFSQYSNVQSPKSTGIQAYEDGPSNSSFSAYDEEHDAFGIENEQDTGRGVDFDSSERETVHVAPDDGGDDEITLGLTPLAEDEIQGEEAFENEYAVTSRDQHEQSIPIEYSQGHDPNSKRSLRHVGRRADFQLDGGDNSEKGRYGGEIALREPNEVEDYTGVDLETQYDLPQEPLPMNESMISQASPPVIVEQVLKRGVSLPSPERKGSAFSSFSPHYTSNSRTNRMNTVGVLSRERENLNSTVETLQQNLRKASEEHNEHLQQYEEEVQNLRARLEEALDDKREIERLANEAMSTQESYQEDFSMFTAEREELRSTVESLRDGMRNLSESHEQQLQRYQEEIESAVKAQRVLEKIADDAVAAHEAQMEETKAIIDERDALQANIDLLQSNLNASLEDSSSQIKRYHREIRELHQKLEAALEEKRSVQIAADEARFALESQAESVRALTVERDQLASTLSSFQGNARKVSGEHSDHLRRFKGEIQQLHLKLDKALSEKLGAEKTADEIRFANDDLRRRLKIVEDELTAFRLTNSRLETLRREDQEIIAKLTTEVRKKDSERLDVEHLKNEVLRLKRNKEHIEGVMTQRQTEFAETLKDRDSDIAEYKSKFSALEGEIVCLRAEMALEKNKAADAMDRIRSYQEEVSLITKECRAKEEGIERLQVRCNHLDSLRQDDQDLIRSLKNDLRKKDEERLAMDKLKHKLLRLSEHRDHLESLIKTRKAEYEEFMTERTNEVAEYMSEVESLKKKLQTAKDADQKHRDEAAAQFQALQESESSMMQAVQQRDDMISRLKLEVSSTKEEIAAIREREKSQSSSAQHEMKTLRQRIRSMESELLLTQKALDDAASRSHNDSRNHKIVLGELERAQDQIKRQKAAMDKLQEEVTSRQRESLRSEEKIFQMESSLRRFQEETKEKVGTMIGRQKESTSVLEKTRRENRAMTEHIKQLERLVEKIRKERDACFESLRIGRTKLAQLSSKSYVNGLDDDFLEIPLNHYKETRPFTGESMTARSKRSVVPEIYITDYSLGDRVDYGLSQRAEEIAACVAISAKNSLQESHDETSQLRSQIHRLEEERASEVSALKDKVRKLELELSSQSHLNNGRSIPLNASGNSRYNNSNKRYTPYQYMDPVE